MLTALLAFGGGHAKAKGEYGERGCTRERGGGGPRSGVCGVVRGSSLGRLFQYLNGNSNCRNGESESAKAKEARAVSISPRACACAINSKRGGARVPCFAARCPGPRTTQSRHRAKTGGSWLDFTIREVFVLRLCTHAPPFVYELLADERRAAAAGRIYEQNDTKLEAKTTLLVLVLYRTRILRVGVLF